MKALQCWYLPFLNIFVCQQILNEPSCEAETSDSFFVCWFVCLVGSQEPEPAVFPIAQPHSRWCSWPDFHCETFFQIKGVLWNTDILSTGRPKLGYCSWLWEFRLISLTTESRNVTPGLKLCWDKQVIQWFDLSMSESQRQMSTAEPI